MFKNQTSTGQYDETEKVLHSIWNIKDQTFNIKSQSQLWAPVTDISTDLTTASQDEDLSLLYGSDLLR